MSIYHPRRMIAAMKFHWFLVACQKNAPRAELLERLVAVRAANQAIEDPTVRTRAIQSCEDIVLRLGYV